MERSRSAPEAGLIIGDGTAGETLDGCALDNSGLIEWYVDGGNSIVLDDGAAINNEVGGSFYTESISGGEGFIQKGDSLAGLAFNNAGDFIGYGGFADVEVPFVNSGIATIEQGGASLGGNGASNSTGVFVNAAGTSLDLLGQLLSPTSFVNAYGSALFLSCNVAGGFDSAGTVYADNSSFTGPVTLGAGSSLEVEGPVSFAPASGGPVTLTTGAISVFSGSDLTGTDSFVADGPVTLYPGSSLSVAGILNATGGLEMSGNISITGTGLINNGTATWDASGAGNIVLSGGATIVNNTYATFTATGTPGTENSISAGDSSNVLFLNAGTFVVADTQADPIVISTPFANDAEVEVPQGEALVLDNQVTNDGSISVYAGAILGEGGCVQNAAGYMVLYGGTIQGGPINNAGNITGYGTINLDVENGIPDVLLNTGQVAPDATGLLSIHGDYTQDAAGTLDIGLGGTTAPSQSPQTGVYDQLSVSGTATLAGQLNVSLFDYFEPGSNDSFEVLRAGAISGSFTTSNSLDVGPGSASQSVNPGKHLGAHAPRRLGFGHQELPRRGSARQFRRAAG